MSGSVDLDRVARALGVSTDAEIVDVITEYRVNLNFCVEMLTAQAQSLAGVFPNAADYLARVVDVINDADDELKTVLVPAEEHMRGDY